MNAVVPKVAEDKLPPKTGAITSGGNVLAIIPQTLDDVYRLASLISASGLAPKDFKTKEACTVAILHGLEIGLKPMQALQRIAVINGRPTLWGDAMLGLIEASGLLEDIQESFEGKNDDFKAVCIVKRKGRPTKVVGEFSIADTKRAGLFGKAGPHTQYRDRMLKMRARSFALRDAFPDVLGGMYCAEEAMDMGLSEMKDVTPKRPELKDFTGGEVGAESTESVDPDTGEVTDDAKANEPAAEYGAFEARNDGMTARKTGKALMSVPDNIKQLKLDDAWQDGWREMDEELRQEKGK